MIKTGNPESGFVLLLNSPDDLDGIRQRRFWFKDAVHGPDVGLDFQYRPDFSNFSNPVQTERCDHKMGALSQDPPFGLQKKYQNITVRYLL